MVFFYSTSIQKIWNHILQIYLFNNLPIGTHTIAVVNAPESRETLESSFKEIFDEVNDIIKSGYITVNGKRVDIEMFLGGDYKVINII